MSDSEGRDTAGAFLVRYPPVGGKQTPKYMALQHSLSAAIIGGFWKPGAKLPTETELAAATPYSLGTLQRALRGLVAQGLLERRRRLGTYVARSRYQLDRPWHCRFLADDGKSFLPVYTTAINRLATARHGPWSLPLNQGDQTIIQVDRRMEVNSEFTVYSRFFVKADMSSEFLEVPLEKLSGANLKALVVRTSRAPLTSITELLRQATIPPFMCDEIGIPQGTVGVQVQATAYAGDAMPVYYQELHVPPTERRLCMESRLPPLTV